MTRTQITLLVLGLGAAGVGASVRAQQGPQAPPPRVIVYKSPT